MTSGTPDGDYREEGKEHGGSPHDGQPLLPIGHDQPGECGNDGDATKKDGYRCVDQQRHQMVTGIGQLQPNELEAGLHHPEQLA